MLWIIRSLQSNYAFVGSACAVGIGLFMKQGVTSVSFISFSVIALLGYDRNWTSYFKQRWFLIFPVALYLMYVAWLFVGMDRGNMSVLVRRATLALFPLCFLFTGKKISAREFEWILLSFVGACILCSLICYATALYNVIVNKSFVVHTVDRDYYYLSYIFLTEAVGIPPIYLSMLANVAVVFAAYTTIRISPGWRIFLIAYLSVFVVLLSSKIGIVCLVGLMAMYVFRIIKQKKMAIAAAGLLIAFSVISVFTVPFLKERFFASLKFDYSQPYGHLWNSNAYRMAIWSSSFETIAESPVHGYGTGRGQLALEETYRKNNFIWGYTESLNPHNEFLAAALDLGILGPLVLLLMIGVPIVSKAREGDWLSVQFLVVMLCYCMIEVILNRQKGVVLVSFFYSLLLWYPTAKKTENS